jgi:hypothetical protein
VKCGTEGGAVYGAAEREVVTVIASRKPHRTQLRRLIIVVFINE